MSKNVARYKVVKDLDQWGVLDETDTLINDAPMTRNDAIMLCAECNHPSVTWDELRAMELRYDGI